MTMAAAGQERLTDQMIDDIAGRLAGGQRVRRTLPPGGRLSIDRQLPFLFVYRPPRTGIDPGLAGLINGEASYLIAPTRVGAHSWIARLVKRIAEVTTSRFGGFLIVEIWAAEEDPENQRDNQTASFRLLVDKNWADSATVERFVGSLTGVRILKRKAKVAVVRGGRLSPPGLPVLLTPKQARELSTRYVGVEVVPIYRDAATGEDFPILQRSLARQMDTAFRRAAFEFARSETAHRPLHYQALGRSTFVRAVKEVDRALSSVADSFDLLLAVTPTNSEQAFRTFQRNRYEKAPQFRYRPRNIDPALLKRDLYNIKVERIEDPTLEHLFREKQRELDLKLTLIGERERPRFLPTGVALYGGVGSGLVDLAASLTQSLAEGFTGTRGRNVDVATFVTRAESELERYRAIDPAMLGRVIVRDDIVSLMVSSGDLLVGSGMSFPAHRVEPLIQHEIGTHVVTYWNGRAQPFRLLATGLANHDELQEGLAVFTEYLVGGLTPIRLKALAGRVLAAHAVVDGATFIDTFRLLRDEHGFSARAAYITSMRVHRGGGLIKDAVYLRGLLKMLDYIKAGERLDTLFVGKMAAEHSPVIEELLRRRVLTSPPLRPLYLDNPDTHYRIERVREGISLEDLTDR
ncbi:MAG: DUF1704 domain-containing protein [Acidimicrobiia bacterium]|nr:DUF1704 domain-containing protein [Acidimicrobiia bacterium]